MSKLILMIAGLAVFSGAAGAATFGKVVLQCAVDEVSPDGARVDVIQVKDGTYRIKLFTGSQPVGTYYTQVKRFTNGLAGKILRDPMMAINLEIDSKRAKNSNISGHSAFLGASYRDASNRRGYTQLRADVVCGKRVSDRWN